jgi:hypothetical protein
MHMICKCMLKKRQLFIYFSKVVSKTMRIGLRLKARSNQDKYISTKIILVLQHVYGQKGWREILVDGDDMLIGESPLKIEF